MKTAVLISVGQPSTNPRLVKEADSLAAGGYKVYVIYTYWTHWAWEADKIVFSKANWTPVLAGGEPYHRKLRYYYTLIRLKIFRYIAQNITLKFGVAEIAQGRTYPELLRKAKSIKADIYIGHILAALPVAVNVAKKYNSRCGFDAEDFHRNEVHDNVDSFQFKISKFIEDKYIPKLNYFTAASPLIAQEYKNLYPFSAPQTINNAFETDDSITVKPSDNKGLRLFWFSQTVDHNRGLDDVIRAMQLLKDDAFELNLLGNARAEIKNAFQAQLKGTASVVNFYNTVAPGDIIKFGSQFELGLALENKVPYNRNICLTNKIFTYIQSGLAIIASDTRAQSGLLNENPGIGKVYNGGNAQSLAEMLKYYYQNREELYKNRREALKLARTRLNWNVEREKFMAIVDNALQVPA